MKNSTSDQKIYRVRMYTRDYGLFPSLLGAKNGLLAEKTVEFDSRKTAMKAVRLFKNSIKKWPSECGVEGPTLIKEKKSKD